MHNKKPNLVLVADGGEARIFKCVGQYQEFQQIMHVFHPHPLTHEHGPDKPGRNRGLETIRSAYEPKTDWHEQQKKDFVKTLSKKVIEFHESGVFEKLTVICPAHLIGLVKHNLQDYLKMGDVEFINGDFTNLTKDEIQHKISTFETGKDLKEAVNAGKAK